MESKLYKVVIGKEVLDNFNDPVQIFSPIDDSIVGLIPRISSSRIETIYSNAKQAFHEYKTIPVKDRKEMLLNFANLLKENWEEISNLIVWETGKSKPAAIDEVDRTVEYIKLTIDEYEKMVNRPLIIDENTNNIDGKIGTFINEPVGVVLAISPFNYPLNLLVSKIAPALISGNVVVYKPATQGSCVGAFISTLLYKAGFKNGEISCIIGKGNEIGDKIISNPNIDLISFTGSSKIGKKIAQMNYMIPTILELGGKDAAIVLKDADLKEAAQKIVKGAFAFNGQRCTAIKRVLVDNKVKVKLIEYINEEVSKLTIGSAKEGNFNITEMININNVKYNLQLILDAVRNKAKTNQIIRRRGNILWPVVLYDVNDKCRIAWEEQFGPVLPIISFDSVEEAIDINNRSHYGLQASIFTTNISYAKKIASLLEVFTVNINNGSSRAPDIFPFGGIKDSGKGVQGIRDSIASMHRIKGIVEQDK